MTVDGSAQRHVFISYAREDDEPFVNRLRTDLISAGVPIWWDRASMGSRGRHYLHEIQEAIQECDRMIAVIGPRAVASDYVRYEWEHAMLFARAVVPILRIGRHEDFANRATVGDAFGLSEDLAQLHWTDFRPERDYADALAELVRQLQTPIASLGRLHGVPPLPPNFLPRREPLEALAHGLLQDINEPCVITSARQSSALHGMGGIGKSVLAAAFGRSAQVRRAFPDGVFWIPMPREGDEQGLLGAIRLLGAALGDDVSNYHDTKLGASALERLLADRRCLLVLDDLWHAEPAEIFRNVAGPSVRLLVTTRIATLADTLGAHVQPLDTLSHELSLQLLASWMNRAVADLPPDAEKVPAACGNLPLALAMVGAILRGNAERVPFVLDRLGHADLARFERRLPNYEHPNLLRAMAVSIEALDPKTQAAYMALAVFPPRTPIYERALACYLESDGWSAIDTQELADRLVARSLARRVGRAQIQLHDLQYAYVAGLCANLPALHERWLDAYRRHCPQGWASGPDDGYFFQHLTHHLAAAGAHAELERLLETFGWLETRLRLLRGADPPCSASQLVDDFDRARSGAKPAANIKRAVVQSLHALEVGLPIAQQLLARLDPEADGPLGTMLADARRWDGSSWLEPVAASLRQSESLLRTYSLGPRAITEIELLEAEGQVVCGSLEMYDNIHIIDLATGNTAATLSDPDVNYSDTWEGEAGIVALAVSADHRLLLTCAEHEDFVKVWDLPSGRVRGRLDTSSHVAAIVAATSPHRAVSIAANELQLWDLASLQPVVRVAGLPSTRTSAGHVIANALTAVALDEEGTLAVAGDDEGHLLLIDLTAGQILRHTRAHDSSVKVVAIDRTRGVALSGSWGKHEQGLRIWQLLDLSSAGVLPVPGASFDALASSPDGVIVSAANGTISVWDLDSRRLVRKNEQSGSTITDLSLTHDGRAVASYIDGTLRVWDARGVATVPSSRSNGHHSPISSIAISGNAQTVASAAREEADILLWDVSSGKSRGALRGHDGGRLTLLALPDGHTLISAGNDRTLIAWNLGTEREVWRLQVDQNEISCVASLNGDGDGGVTIATGDWSGRVVIRDLRTGETAELPRREADRHWRSHPGPVRSLAPGPAGGQLLVGTENTVELWDIATLSRVETYEAVFGFDRDEHFVVGVCALPDGRILSACTDGCVMVRKPGTDRRADNPPGFQIFPRHATSTARNRDGSMVVMATRNKSVEIVRARSELHWICAFTGDSDMLACACATDGSMIASGDSAGNVHILRIRENAGRFT